MISLQQGHFGLGVLLSEWKLLVGETNAGTDPARQRVVLWQQESQISDSWPIYTWSHFTVSPYREKFCEYSCEVVIYLPDSWWELWE